MVFTKLVFHYIYILLDFMSSKFVIILYASSVLKKSHLLITFTHRTKIVLIASM